MVVWVFAFAIFFYYQFYLYPVISSSQPQLTSPLHIYARMEGRKERRKGRRIHTMIAAEKGKLCVQYSFSHRVLVRLHISLKKDMCGGISAMNRTLDFNKGNTSKP